MQQEEKINKYVWSLLTTASWYGINSIYYTKSLIIHTVLFVFPDGNITG